MIVVDTSVLIAIMLDEPEAETFKSALRQEPSIAIGWPTLLETRTVLTAKRFSNPGDIVTRFFNAPNITAVAFDADHYRAAEHALERYGKGRHPAGLNMGDCFSYAVATVKQPLLFNQVQLSITHANLIAQGISANMAGLDQSISRDVGLLDNSRLNGMTCRLGRRSRRRFLTASLSVIARILRSSTTFLMISPASMA